ncbi:unnamed protein product, partial [Discosporangium mesarthrocarpum]
GSNPPPVVPFLNLPSLGKKRHGSGGWRGQGPRESPSELGLGLPIDGSGHRDWTVTSPGRPMAGLGGVLVSAGRAMVTAPGRPRSSRLSREDEGAASGEYSGEGNGGGSDDDGVVTSDDSGSGGSISVGYVSGCSGSTDIEFLRRRAEAKLLSLQRGE